jgi:hypothetical protein
MKFEKYLITSEGTETPVSIVRWGFGVAGEEIQRLLLTDAKQIRVKVVGPEKEILFGKDKEWRLLDIKQRVKNLTHVD